MGLRVVYEEQGTSRIVILCDGEISADTLDGVAAFVARQRDRLFRAPRQRCIILNDGPDRFVLVDAETDDPSLVYATQAEAEAELSKCLAEQ